MNRRIVFAVIFMIGILGSFGIQSMKAAESKIELPCKHYYENAILAMREGNNLSQTTSFERRIAWNSHSIALSLIYQNCRAMEPQR